MPEQNWMQYANLAFGVTTIHDPSNDTASVFAAAELQRAGRIVAPRIFSTGTILYGAHQPGYTAEIDSLRRRASSTCERLKDVGAISVKSYQQPRRDQRQQMIAAGARAGHDGRARGRREVPAQHDRDRRRPHRDRARAPAGRGPTRTCMQLWSQSDDRLHADARRGLRRPVGRELLVRPHERVGERAADALHAALRRSSRARSGASRPPTSTTTTSASPRFAKRAARPRRVGAARRARPARRPRRALGDVDARAGRLHALGGAARGDDRRRALRRPRPRRRLARSRASSPTSW